MNSKERTSTLLKNLKESELNSTIKTNLYTSDRVLARVTDGIYRLPSSALRELICNAYDADATVVDIQTNPPSFDEIIVQDNGNGLSLESLAFLIHNIGGSAKRTGQGSSMNICNKKDPTRSPGGRRLIGKIGIGLFSVAQLTKSFQIITKRRGEEFRTVADVVLKTHSEEELVEGNEFITGDVDIWKVPAKDIEGHGTRIILRDILPKTQEHLRSTEEWMRCYPDEYENLRGLEIADDSKQKPPHFHIGRVEQSLRKIVNSPQLPWDTEKVKSPSEKMQAFVNAVCELRLLTKKPTLAKYLDNYFQMIWALSLAVPVDYVEKHPFDLKTDQIKVFQLSNELAKQAQAVESEVSAKIRELFSFSSPERGENGEFKVFIDGIELLRPIKFLNLPRTERSKVPSLLFVGEAKPDLSSIPKDQRGGDLEFEAYFFWNSTIVPKEHAGIMIRINDASGTSFDETFLKYPISEIVRTSQVTAEIYVKKGLDPALNIDRESFNFSHPHYQYISMWVHNAFRQLSNKQKDLAKIAREAQRKEQYDERNNKMQEIVSKFSSRIADEEESAEVIFVDNAADAEKLRLGGSLAYERSAMMLPQESKPVRMSTDTEGKVKAILQVLERMEILDYLPFSKQQELIAAIAEIISK